MNLRKVRLEALSFASGLDPGSTEELINSANSITNFACGGLEPADADKLWSMRRSLDRVEDMLAKHLYGGEPQPMAAADGSAAIPEPAQPKSPAPRRKPGPKARTGSRKAR